MAARAPTENALAPREETRRWSWEAKFEMFIHWGVFALLWARASGFAPSIRSCRTSTRSCRRRPTRRSSVPTDGRA